MADNFFKIKNGLNLPTLSNDPTVTPPANSAVGDMAFYNGKLYIYNGTAWGIKPGSGSTGLIVNADVDAAAAIAGTKVDPNFGSQNVTTSGGISTTGSGGITAAGLLRTNSQLQVYASGASEAVYIEQTGSGNALVVADQASPDTTVTVIDASGNVGMGVAPNATLTDKLTVAGDVSTTGDIKLATAKGIESSAAASTLNVGTGANTTTLNLGTGSSTQTVNIGTGAGTTTINIGATGDTVVVAGTLTTVNTTNLDVADKNITLNKGGLAGTANGSGISIEAAGSSVASITFDQTDGGAQPQNTFTLSGTGSLALPAGTTAQRPNTASNGMIRYNSTNGAFEGYASGAWSGIGGGAVTDKVTQASHAFVVGDVLYMNGATYAKAKADVSSTAEVVGMVSRVVDASNFELTLNGEVSGLTGLTAGENYFLSAATAGAITATEPSVVGQVSLPVGVASSTTTFYVAIKRGNVVGAANARTTIGLAQSATTTVQNAGAYEAGGLSGWIFIDATTDLRFYIQAQFAKNGAGTDYNLSYQTSGETPPAGFSMTITAAGLIQVTLPAIAGFTSANINFALNAPAVGARLPLQISSGLITPDGSAMSSVGYSSGAVDVTMSATSSQIQNIISPAAARTVTLPSTGIKAGYTMQLVVSGATETNFVKLQSSGGNEVDRICGTGFITVMSLQDTPTTAGHWTVLSLQDSGTWTPVIQGSISNPTYTTSTIEGVYRRNGNQINFKVGVYVTVTVAGSGNMLVTLPVIKTPATSASFNFHCVVGYLNNTSVQTVYALAPQPGQQRAILYTNTNASPVLASTTGLYHFMCVGSYMV